MNATPHRPAAAPTNRIARHFGDPAPAEPLPATPEARRDFWADAVFAATRFYVHRLHHHDPHLAAEAAAAILELEKTRLRHGRDLAGSTDPGPLAVQDAFDKEYRPSEEAELYEECMSIVDDVDRARSVFDRTVPPDELAAAEAFARTPEYRMIVERFVTHFLEERGEDLPEREHDRLAKELFIRRLRRSGPPRPGCALPPPAWERPVPARPGPAPV